MAIVLCQLFFSSAFVSRQLNLVLVRTMGKAAAKPKTAPGKDVVKKAAKRVNKAAAAKSSAKATAKAAAKVKVEPPSPHRSPRVEEIVPVSQAATVDKKDISNFLGQMKRASSDDAVALYNHYKTLGKFDAQKQTLVAKWKADKSCKWYSSYSESFEKTSVSKKQGAVGWSTRPAGDQSLFFPLLLLIPLPSSGGKLPMRCIEIQPHHLSRNFWTLWKAALRSGMSLCRKKFLKDKGEKKYFWSSASGLAKFEEVEKHSEEFSSSVGGYDSKGGKPKGGATGDSAEEQAKYPVYTELKKKVGEAATVSRCLSDSDLLVVYYLNC